MNDNEEITRQLNLTKQRINEGSKAVRDQIDNNILPIIPNSKQQAADKVREARRAFTSGDQKAKRLINDAITMLRPPGPYDVLPSRYSYPKTQQFIAPFFIPAIFIARPILRSDVDWFANRMARNRHGNVIRGFSFGNWEHYWTARNWAIFPYTQNRSEKFELDEYNDEYWEELYFRIEAFTKRGIFVFIDLVDNCSLHKRQNGWWAEHPWNGMNNMNGTSTWNNSVYHYYEDQHQDVPGIRETKKYVEKFYRDFVERTYSRFKPMIGYGAGNEVHAGFFWHRIQKNIINEVIPKSERARQNMITSMCIDDFYGKNIWHDWLYSLHGCCNNLLYGERDKHVPNRQYSGIKAKRYIVSQDGCFPMPTAAQTERFVEGVLADERAGFEQNLRPLLVEDNGSWRSLYREPEKIDWTLRSLNFAYAGAVKKAWFRHNNWSI